MSDKYFSSVVLLCGFNGADSATSFTDESNAARVATFSGNAQLDTGQRKWGTASLQLDGNGDFVSFTHSTDLSVETGDLTIEAWIRPAETGRLQSITGKRASSSGQEHAFYLNTDNRLRVLVMNSGSNVAEMDGVSVCALNQWHHVAMSRIGATWHLHTNGVLEDTAVESGAPQANTQPFRIGRDGFSTLRDFNGWIDEVRFTKGVARYGAFNFIPPRGPFARKKTVGTAGRYSQPVVLVR